MDKMTALSSENKTFSELCLEYNSIQSSSICRKIPSVSAAKWTVQKQINNICHNTGRLNESHNVITAAVHWIPVTVTVQNIIVDKIFKKEEFSYWASKLSNIQTSKNQLTYS